MTARPILFSAPMIRALLDGRKTQTRRIVKPQPAESFSQGYTDNQPDPMKRRSYGWSWVKDHRYPHVSVGSPEMLALCPYGQPGDTLWVRETWRELEYPTMSTTHEYRATSRDSENHKWRPSIYMPRWVSRITLVISSVRVQRLQDISEADARAEGCSARPFPGPWWQGYRELNGALVHEQAIGDQPPDWMIEPKRMADTPHLDLTAVDDFRSVWHSIHGPDSWGANPWVWALTFDVIRANVDEQKP